MARILKFTGSIYEFRFYMEIVKNLKSAFFNSSTLKKKSVWILVIFCLLLLWGIIRSCSRKGALESYIYHIARDSTGYPLHLEGKERNLLAFTNDLMTAIAKETGIRFIWIETGFDHLLEGLDDGSYDGIISSMRPTGINQDIYAFSDLFFELGPVLIVPEDSKVTSLKDMKDKTLGIRTSTSFIFNAIKDKVPIHYRLITYNNINQALEALVHNQIDGLILEAILAYTYTEGFYAGRLKVVTPPLTDEGLRLITKRDPQSELLITSFNEGLEELRNNGIYDELIKKWDLINPENQYLRE
jgi:polar amino acid transport system substrate-binding protein